MFIEREYLQIEESEFGSRPDFSHMLHHEISSYVTSIVDEKDKHNLLPESGFSPADQVATYIQTIIEGKSHEKSSEEIKKEVSQMISSDLLTFYYEYLQRRPVLPIWIDHDGKQLNAPKYGDKKYTDTITDKERDGVPKNVMRHIDQIYPDLPVNSLVITTSPQGWNGMGQSYPEAQIYFYEKLKNGIRAYTVRTSANLDNLEDTTSKFFKTNPEKDLYPTDRIKNQNRVVHVFDDEKNPTKKAIKFLETLQSNMQSEDIWVDKKGDQIIEHSLNEIKREIKNIDQIVELDDEVGRVIKHIEEYIHNLKLDLLDTELKSLINELADGIYKMHAEEFGVEFNPPKQLADVQQLEGCNGGGKKSKSKEELRKLGYKEGYCQRCGRRRLVVMCGSRTLCDPCGRVFYGLH